MTTTTGKATGSFTIKAWNEQPWAEAEEAPKLTDARVTTTYTGDLEGEGTYQLLMVYDGADATYTGDERVAGSLDGHSGSFVLRLDGGFEGGAARTSGRWSRGRAPATWPGSRARAGMWPGRASPPSPGSCAGRWGDRAAPLPGRHPARRARLGLPAGRGAAGVGELAVRYGFDRPATPPGVPGNALDIGVVDERGYRGWSGGARDGFAISASGATPGYLPGPVHPGTWQLGSGPWHRRPPGAGLVGRGDPGHGPAGPGVRPRPGARAAGGRGRGWAPADLGTPTPSTPTARAPRPSWPPRPARPGSTSSPPPSTTTTSTSPRLGRPRRAGPPRDRRPGGHHPRRPLAGPRAGPGGGGRLALPGHRRRP